MNEKQNPAEAHLRHYTESVEIGPGAMHTQAIGAECEDTRLCIAENLGQALRGRREA